MTPSRTPYPTDVSDDEWAFVAPYLTLLPEDAGQRISSLREVFNGLRWIVRAGAPWRMMPKGAPGSPRRPFLIVAPCNRPPKAEGAQAMMAPSFASAAKCMPLSIRWAIGSTLLVTPANEQD
jgi:Putative transposase of IS4/5 family (DUF4096)